MSFVTNSLSNLSATGSHRYASNENEIKVEGNRISWPDDGWYEVQSAISYNTMSEGGNSATMPHGTYTIINHTTGERFENIVVGSDAMASLQTKDIVHLDLPIVDIMNPGNSGANRPDIPGNNLQDPSDNANSAFSALEGLAFDAMSNNSDGPVAAQATVTSTVYAAGTPDETHVNTTHTPDTSAATSNQPYTHETQVYNSQGLVATHTYVTSPTGMTIGPAGTNGVETEEPAPAPETSRPPTPSGNQNSENDSDSHGGGSSGSSGGANNGRGNETSSNPHTL